MAHIKYKSKSSPIQTLTVGPGVSPDQPAPGRVADYYRR